MKDNSPSFSSFSGYNLEIIKQVKSSKLSFLLLTTTTTTANDTKKLTKRKKKKGFFKLRQDQ